MTFRDTPWPDGTPCWIDLMVPDVAKAQEFYGGLFGWEFTDASEESNPYLMATLDGRQVAGVGRSEDQSAIPAAWTTYIATSDVESVAAAVDRAGGKVAMPPMDIPPAGKFAVFADPTGVVFGAWQAGENIGAEVVQLPGSWIWNEVMSDDYDVARNFYAEVFGYSYDDMSGEDFRYSTIKAGGEIVGGIGAAMPGDAPESPHWRVYFAVPDADVAVRRITELGGTVVGEPFDSPYGRIAVVTDDQGVQFRVMAAAWQG